MAERGRVRGGRREGCTVCVVSLLTGRIISASGAVLSKRSQTHTLTRE